MTNAEKLSMYVAAVGGARDMIRKHEALRMECVGAINYLRAQISSFEREIKEIRAEMEDKNDEG